MYNKIGILQSGNPAAVRQANRLCERLGKVFASLAFGVTLVMFFLLLIPFRPAAAQDSSALQGNGGNVLANPQFGVSPAPLAATAPYTTITEIKSVASVHPDGTLMVGFAVMVSVNVKPGASEVTQTPTGAVNISTAGGPTCSITLEDGDGFCALFFTSSGAFTITANYTGVSGTWLSSSDSEANKNVQPLSLNHSLAAGRYHTCHLSNTGGMKCWGLDLSYPTSGGVPSTVNNVKEARASGYSTCAIKTDGLVECWGNNSFVNTAPGGKFLWLSVGKDHACAIDAAYHLNCWGDPESLPLTTTAGLSKPTVEVKALSAGKEYDCAIKKSDSKLDCWGTPSFNETYIPNEAVKAVSVGERHACAILNADNHVECWGDYSITGWGYIQFVEIVSGSDYACARKQSDNKIVCKGNLSNIPPYDAGTAFTTLASDFLHLCALQSTGGGSPYLACWGNNTYSQAPRLSLSPTSIPAQLPKDRYFSQTFSPDGGTTPHTLSQPSGSLPTGLTRTGFDISGKPTALGAFNFVLRLIENFAGSSLPLELRPLEQSYNTTIEDATTTLTLIASPSTTPAGSPVSVNVHVNDSGTPVLTGTVIITGSISGGAQQNGCTLSVDGSGNASCALFFPTTGNKTVSGRYLGNSYYFPSPETSQAVTITPVIINPAISAGEKFNCSIDANGVPYCWGKDDSGQSSPPALTFNQHSSGQSHACGRALDGKIYCWGWDGYGVTTPPTDAGFTAVASGATHACGLFWDGSVRCWGNPANSRTNHATGPFVDLSAGWDHTCGRLSDGSVSCWGVNTSGQATPPAGVLFSSLSGGGAFTCGIRSSDGGLQCWGSIAAPLGGTGYKSLGSGYAHACAVQSNDSLACWGSNSSGQSSPPAGAFSQVSAGFDHTCAIRTDGFMRCWGANLNQQAPVIAITPVSLPTLDVNTAWSTDLDASGGRIPTYTFSYSGDFPAGLTLNSSSGVINGAPTLPGHYTYTVRVVENGLTPALIQERVYNQTVRSDVQVEITSVTPASRMLGKPILISVSVTESPGGAIGVSPTMTVTVSSNDGKSCKTLLASGVGSCYIFFTSSGDKTLSASYPGDANFKPSETASPTAINVVPFSQTPDVHTGLNSTYIHKADGTLKCLGSGCPVGFPGAGVYPDVDVSDELVCVLQPDGTARCKRDAMAPQIFGSLLTQLAVGLEHACAIDVNGLVACWGDNTQGQSTPPASSFSALSAAARYTCGIRSADSAIQCWGDAPSGIPVGAFSQLSAASDHACAVTTANGLACWGDDTYGQSSPPGAGLFSSVSAGDTHSCALGQDGRITCWGNDANARSTEPFGLYTALDTYANHNCALRAGPKLTCWGPNENGEAPRILILQMAKHEIPALTYYEHAFYPAGGLKPYLGSLTSGALPPGLHLGMLVSPAGVVLYGTPTMPDVYTYTLSWEDSADIPLWREEPYTLTVTGADLQAQIVPAHPDTALYQTHFSFQYVFTNATVLDAPQVLITVTLPAGLSELAHSGIPGCALVGLQLNCTVDPMLAWDTLKLTVSGTVNADVGALLTTTVDIQPGQADWPEIAPADNHDQVVVQVAFQSLAFADDFSAGVLDSRWSDGDRITTTTAIDYLGDFTYSDQLHLLLENLPPHRRVIVSFDLYVIGDWQGNGGAPLGLWQFRQAGQPTLLSTTFCNEQPCQQAYPLDYPDGDFPAGYGADGFDQLGYTPVKDTRYRLSFSFLHNAADLDLLFASLNLPLGARWGLDNIVIWLDWSSHQAFLPVIWR